MASESLDKLFACLRTPIQSWEKETRAFTLPEGLPPAPRRPLIDHPDFEIPKPSLVGVLGFLGWENRSPPGGNAISSPS